MIPFNKSIDLGSLPTKRASSRNIFIVLVRTLDQEHVQTIAQVKGEKDPWKAACAAFLSAPDKERLLKDLSYEIIVMCGKRKWVIDLSIDQLRSQFSSIDAAVAIESVHATLRGNYSSV